MDFLYSVAKKRRGLRYSSSGDVSYTFIIPRYFCMSMSFLAFVMTSRRFMLLRGVNSRRSFLMQLSSGKVVLRRSNIIYLDCCIAERKLFSMVRELLPLGHFISQFIPSIDMSGVLAPRRRFGAMNMISLPRLRKNFAVMNSCFAGGVSSAETSMCPGFCIFWHCI